MNKAQPLIALGGWLAIAFVALGAIPARAQGPAAATSPARITSG